MNLLLDTCTLLWWWSEPERLSRRSETLIRDPANTVYVSAASAWEVATKYRIGKYPNAAAIISEWEERLDEDTFKALDMRSTHALRAGSLPSEHRDPFDRMIAAQSIIESIPVVTPDTAIEALGAGRVW